MTVNDLLKRLQKMDPNKMILYKESPDTKGWTNIAIKENYNNLIIYPDKTRIFSDGG